MRTANRRVLLARVPTGLPTPADFKLDTAPIPEPLEGEFLCRTLWLSLDPYYRNVMKGHPLYGEVLRPGEVMIGETVAQVVVSRLAGYAPGDYIVGRNGWQEFALSKGEGVCKLPQEDLPLSAWLGVLGMPGLTGYAGMLELGGPEPGETVVVSAATGPVGSTAGQVARLAGARVIGIAGSAEKCDYAVHELGYAACINYRAQDLRDALEKACPDRIHVYFDNVGGETLNAVFTRLARGARIILCGMIGAYSMETPPAGPWLGPVVAARAHLQGLVVYDHLHRQSEQVRAVSAWIRAGHFKWKEDVSVGLERAPEAFCRLMRGENFGKALVRIDPG